MGKNPLDKMPYDFSLMIGGPLYQLYLRTRLVKPALQLCKRRIVIICLLTWLPLLILSSLFGPNFHSIRVPFLLDIDAHIRFLGALALFIAAELLAHRKIYEVVQQFIKNNIIADAHREQFHDIISSTIRLRNSIAVEIILIILIFTLGHWVWTHYIVLPFPTWYATTTNDHIQLTPAGYWYLYISLPIFQFIVFRWYFRIFVWYRLLWKISRLPLQLNSLHPDRSGGLGFLSQSLLAFLPVLIAHTLFLSGFIGNRIWHSGTTVFEYKLEIIGMIIFLLLLVTLPLLFFVVKLAKLKQAGLLSFGSFGHQYVDDFYSKWIRSVSSEKKERSPLGSSDIQSLADLSNSFNIVGEMRLLPMSMKFLVRFVFVLLLPLAPLLLTAMPLEKIIGGLIKIIL